MLSALRELLGAPVRTLITGDKKTLVWTSVTPDQVLLAQNASPLTIVHKSGQSLDITATDLATRDSVA